MGSVSLHIGDGTARFRSSSFSSSAVTILMLISVVSTNLFAFYAFTSSPRNQQQQQQQHLLFLNQTRHNISLISQQVSLILREIDSSQKQLSHIENNLLGYDTIDLSLPNTPNELKAFLERHILPLGRDAKTGITEMVSSVGHSCAKSVEFLAQYMSYRASRPCPDDWSLAQRLILRGCEPLPRRRCLAKTMPKVGLASFPFSLWKNVSAKSVTWSGLGCKNFECLSGKKLTRECVGCFDLSSAYGRERFVKARSKNDFVIDDVLALGGGGMRVGFDIGGGSGTFAARMAERDVTVITNTLNIGAPYSEFIAARGLFPLFLSLNHRFPFYDNVFDLVHVASGLEFGGKPEKFEFLMFDIDRILRPGGLFWLDNFHCANGEKKKELTRFIEKFGYKKLKWVVGVDTASGSVYLSAILQKPVRV